MPVVFESDAVGALEFTKAQFVEVEERLLGTFFARSEIRAAVDGVPVDAARRAVFEEDQEHLLALAAERNLAREHLAAATRVYTFRSLGYKAWRALKAAHPSKDPQLAFDEDSIAATLLREASHDPKLSAEMVEEILTSPDWSEGQVRLLLMAAVRAQS